MKRTPDAIRADLYRRRADLERELRAANARKKGKRR